MRLLIIDCSSSIGRRRRWFVVRISETGLARRPPLHVGFQFTRERLVRARQIVAQAHSTVRIRRSASP